jgi:tetratricopeptide (TPR) repeat protein
MRAALLAVLVVCAPALAHADAPTPGAGAVDARAEAKRLAARAQVHFDLGEYAKAINDYREAYRMVPSPGILYNLGQAYRLVGDCVSATTMYRNYLRLAPHSPYRQLVKQHLSTMSECNRARDPAGASSAEDDPMLANAPKAIGKRGGRVASLGGPVDDGGNTPQRRALRKKRAGLAIGGGGAVLVALGAYFSVDASRKSDEVSALYARGAPWKDIEDLDQRGQRSDQLGMSFAIAGGVAMATGATFYALGWRDERRAQLAVTPHAGGAAMTMSWGF